MTALPGQTSWQVKLTRQQSFLELGVKSDLGIEQSRVNSNVAYDGKYNIKLKRVLSNSQFTDNAEVMYAYPNPMSYEPRSQGEYRDVKHVILTSFGIYWDAQVINSGRRIISSNEEGKGIVYSSEADSDRSFHSPNRMWEGIRRSVDPTKKLSGAHFYIDRLGNLVVMGDVDMTMTGSAPSTSTAVIVALEDAGYVLTDDWYATRPNSRAIGFGANRNMGSFGVAGAQYNTLTILLKKLELAFPEIREGASSGSMTVVGGRGVTLPFADRDGLAIKEITGSDPGGYITDLWPNFTEESVWETLFESVDEHENIAEEDVFKKDGLFVLPWLGDVPPARAESFPTTELGESFSKEPSDQAAALQRVFNLLNSATKTQQAEESAKERLEESNSIGVTIADSVSLIESAEDPSEGIALFDTPEDDQDSDPTVCDAWED